jgi:hypothetical protein
LAARSAVFHPPWHQRGQLHRAPTVRHAARNAQRSGRRAHASRSREDDSAGPHRYRGVSHVAALKIPTPDTVVIRTVGSVIAPGGHTLKINHYHVGFFDRRDSDNVDVFGRGAISGKLLRRWHQLHLSKARAFIKSTPVMILRALMTD